MTATMATKAAASRSDMSHMAYALLERLLVRHFFWRQRSLDRPQGDNVTLRSTRRTSRAHHGGGKMCFQNTFQRYLLPPL
jgi:hypothetical protein